MVQQNDGGNPHQAAVDTPGKKRAVAVGKGEAMSTKDGSVVASSSTDLETVSTNNDDSPRVEGEMVEVALAGCSSSTKDECDAATVKTTATATSNSSDDACLSSSSPISTVIVVGVEFSNNDDDSTSLSSTTSLGSSRNPFGKSKRYAIKVDRRHCQRRGRFLVWPSMRPLVTGGNGNTRGSASDGSPSATNDNTTSSTTPPAQNDEAPSSSSIE